MATFYLLPPRACLEEAVEQILQRLLPGLPLPEHCWDLIVERLAAAAHWPQDVFLIPRDELPEDEPWAAALIAAFGAEPGDQIVEVSWHHMQLRRSVLSPSSHSTPAPTASTFLQ